MPGKRSIANVLKYLAILPAFFIQTLYAQQAKTNPRNPVIEGWYADPEGVIFDNKYWIFPTYSAKYSQQVFFGCLFINRYGDLEKASEDH